MPDDRIEPVLDELESARVAIEMACPGDLVALFVDKPQRVWKTLLELQSAYAREPALVGREALEASSMSPAKTLDVIAR